MISLLTFTRVWPNPRSVKEDEMSDDTDPERRSSLIRTEALRV